MKGLLTVITVAALALLIGVGQALAQPAAATTTPPAVKPGKVEGGWHGGGCGFRHFRRPMLGEKLGLTDPQKEQVKTIMTAAREEAKTATDRAAKVAIFKAAFDKIRTTVLTDEQRKTLTDVKARWEARRGEAPAAKPAPAAPAKS